MIPKIERQLAPRPSLAEAIIADVKRPDRRLRRSNQSPSCEI